MMIRSGSLVAIAGAVLLTGCANWDVDGTAAMPDKGDAFAKALHKEYIERAKFEVGEEDWISVDFFTGRAKLAAEGMPPAPQAPSERKLLKDAADIGSGYKKLVDELAAGASKIAPVACAKSQAWLEHWMEQAEEGHQANDIAWTRGEFMKAIPDCVAVAQPVKAVKPVFHIYFPFSSSALTKEAKAVIADIVSLFKAEKPKVVNVAGHTDTMGTNDLNMKLGAKRAEAVAKVLKAEKVKPIKTTSFGESMLPKPTADNVKEQINRQVTVTFGK
ncbi:MAG: OmpA family protein [Rhodospirillaceae bacterium]|nr:OmpA family protein [Rhodospirillaceae bacterium]